MSETLAHYAFLPWMRQGLGNKIAEEDALGAPVSGSSYADQRAKLTVDLKLKYRKLSNGSVDEDIISKAIHIVGPADIKGINPRAILRTEPKQNVSNFEANLLPYIEFYEEDFPWRYTPVSPQTSGDDIAKLRPWISLLVLAEGEYELRDNGDAPPVVSISDSAVHQALGPQDETWAWCHVHLNQSLDGTSLTDEVSDILDNDPDIGISRIICPRKLQKSTSYTAFLIPTFEVGRLAGLSQDTSQIKAQAPAWVKENGQVSITTVAGFPANTFPYYYQWAFKTGKYGDFETLVSILTPFAVEADAGKMDMDIQNPGYGLEGVADTQTIGFEGALRPPDFSSKPFPDQEENKAFTTQLKDLLNLSIEAAEGTGSDNVFYNAAFVEDPIITPPIYGYWHAMTNKLRTPGASWLEDLNLDPRFRGMAGLGTRTVQDKQEEYMEQAWQQIGDINAANQKIREAELAKAVNQQIYKKHLLTTDDDQFSQLTGAVHRRIMNSEGNKTVRQTIKESRIPTAVNSATFKRITRPEKKNIRRINEATATGTGVHRQVVSKFNTGSGSQTDPQITAAKLKQASSNTLSSTAAVSDVSLAKQNYLAEDTYLVRDLLFQSVEIAGLETFNATTIKGKIDETAGEYELIRNSDPSRWANLKGQVESAIDQMDSNTYQVTEGQIEVQLASNTYNGIFQGVSADPEAETPSGKAFKNVVISRELQANEELRIGRVTTLADIETYENLLSSFTNLSTQPSFVAPQLREPVPDLEGTFTHLKDQLSPQRTIPAKALSNIRVWENGTLVPLEKLKPIMAYPEFEEPVYEALSQISQDFILPNVAQLPANSITILETNQSVVESYLTGMNHEMARELLWREYPTDQRGSYFRQFWDVRDNLFEEDDELKKDIQEIHQWKNPLGYNRMENGAANLVLVVRGDLLLKYPGTILYAQKAEYNDTDPTQDRELPEEITEENTLFPLFSAELEPDIFLFGFALSVEEARGQRVYHANTDTSNLNPGWFFVFRERPGQVKFGLDDYADPLGNADTMPDDNLPSWNDLSWEHLVTNKEDLTTYVMNFSKPIQINTATSADPAWGNNSADMASILYQNPVIFARHAAEML